MQFVSELHQEHHQQRLVEVALFLYVSIINPLYHIPSHTQRMETHRRNIPQVLLLTLQNLP